MAPRLIFLSPFSWTWPAVLAGLCSSLVVQILLAMLGFGTGLLQVDVPSPGSLPAHLDWATYVWWAASAVIAAFIGGAVAATNAPDQSVFSRIAHSMAAWAVATVVVVGASAWSPGSVANIAGNLAGPSYAATARLSALSRPPTLRETTGSFTDTRDALLEDAKRQFGHVMLATFFTLLVGAAAAAAAGLFTGSRRHAGNPSAGA